MDCERDGKNSAGPGHVIFVRADPRRCVNRPVRDRSKTDMDIHELMRKVWPDWEITERIGEGSFGEVYKAKRTDLAGESWSAIKVTTIPRSESELDALRSEGLSPEQAHTYLENVVRDYSHEIRLMESVKGHSNIVSIEDHSIYEHTDRTAWNILIRMELLTPLTKYSALNDISEKDVVRLGTDLCRALSVCAARRIVHRDIKPENIFVNEFGDFKLGDFGVARKLEHTTMGFTRTGALNFMAPEVFNDAKPEMSFEDAAKTDIYSLGLVMYFLANHSRLPFLPEDKKILSLDDRKKAFAERLSGKEFPRPCEGISEGLWQVIRKACAFDPGQRYASAREMQEAIEGLGTADKVPTTPPPADPPMDPKPDPQEDPQEDPREDPPTDRKPKKQRRIMLAALAVVLLLSAGTGLWLSQHPNGKGGGGNGGSGEQYMTDAPENDSPAGDSTLTSQIAVLTDGSFASATPMVVPTPSPVRSGSHVTFGHYEQDNNTENGTEPIEWLVLDVQDGKALLLSRYGLYAQQYNTSYSSVTWETCSLRAWLNGEFLNSAFSAKEQQAIQLATVDNSSGQGRSGNSTSGGEDTKDHIFLLSYAEAWKYFSSESARQCQPTKYAVAHGAFTYNGNCWWWLRSPGLSSSSACNVGTAGACRNYFVTYDYVTVRPALWVDLESDVFSAADQ